MPRAMGLVGLLLKNIRLVWLLYAWPEVIQDLYRKEVIINSDLEWYGLLLFWLIIEEVCPESRDAYVALWSDNSPTVIWLKCLAASGSKIAMQLIWALLLLVKQKWASPLTPLDIQGKKNAMTDIPSRSFVIILHGFAKLILTCTIFQWIISFSQPGLLDRLQPFHSREN